MTISEQTRQKARGIGGAVITALGARGVRAVFVVRDYEPDTVSELKNLPLTSARLGVVLTAANAKATPEIVREVGRFAPVVYTGVNVIVCEVAETAAEAA
jgi:hypothetical protein